MLQVAVHIRPVCCLAAIPVASCLHVLRSQIMLTQPATSSINCSNYAFIDSACL